MRVKNPTPKLLKYAKKHNLIKKLTKQILLLETDTKHPSLKTEKLEPKEFELYSFRIDRKYRAIFHILLSGEIEIIDINDHYQ